MKGILQRKPSSKPCAWMKKSEASMGAKPKKTEWTQGANPITINSDGSASIRTRDGFCVIVDQSDLPILEGFRWFTYKARSTRYAATHIRKENGKDTVRNIHTILLFGNPKGRAPEVDHIDRNGLNNQRINLRPATPSQNRMNRGRTRANRSGFKGVIFYQNAWQARIGANGKYLTIGKYSTPEEAARAYDQEAIRLHGEFAVTNFPTKEL